MSGKSASYSFDRGSNCKAIARNWVWVRFTFKPKAKTAHNCRDASYKHFSLNQAVHFRSGVSISNAHWENQTINKTGSLAGAILEKSTIGKLTPALTTVSVAATSN